jgi:hypothetical protein
MAGESLNAQQSCGKAAVLASALSRLRWLRRAEGQHVPPWVRMPTENIDFHLRFLLKKRLPCRLTANQVKT